MTTEPEPLSFSERVGLYFRMWGLWWANMFVYAVYVFTENDSARQLNGQLLDEIKEIDDRLWPDKNTSGEDR